MHIPLKSFIEYVPYAPIIKLANSHSKKGKKQRQEIRNKYKRNKRYEKVFKKRSNLDDFIQSQEKIIPRITTKANFQIKVSAGEAEIIRILRVEDIHFIHDRPFKDLINPKTRQKLRFDFYLPKYKSVIEFDGKQHYQENKDFHTAKGSRSFSEQQFRDKFKDDFCNWKGIKILRIRYDQFLSIRMLILNFLAPMQLLPRQGP